MSDPVNEPATVPAQHDPLGKGARILVGVDGSPDADRALAWALQRAALRDARVTVLHAFRVPRLASGKEDEERRPGAMDVLTSALGRVADPATRAEVAVETQAVTGRGAAEAILDHAPGADLVVVGRRGRGGFAALLLGSVSQQVAAHCPVPVAVVPTRGDRQGDSPRRVVVGVDGSESSLGALRWAAGEAGARKVSLTPVYAYPGIGSGAPFDAMSSLTERQVEALEQEGADAASTKLERVLAGVTELKGVEVHPQVVRGAASSVLVRAAADPATLLVVGSRGHGGFAGLLLGSVSQQCLQHTAGPVVVTPATR